MNADDVVNLPPSGADTPGLFVEPVRPDAGGDTPPSRPKRTYTKRTRAARVRSRAGAADKPPRVRAPRTPSAPGGPRPKRNAQVYGAKLLPWYAMAGMVMPRVVGTQGSAVYGENIGMMAASWGPLAAENDAVAAMIDKLTESSAVLGVVMAHVAVGLGIAHATGRGPAEFAMLAPMLRDLANNPEALAAMFAGGGESAQGSPSPVSEPAAA